MQFILSFIEIKDFKLAIIKNDFQKERFEISMRYSQC